jgi:hypothetical protein
MGVGDSLPKDFLALADLRGGTSVEVGALERELKRLQDSLPGAELRARGAPMYVARARADSTALAAKAQRTDAEESRLAAAMGYLRQADAEQGLPKVIRDSLSAIEKQLLAKRRFAAEIQARIASLLNPEQQFKKTMSMTFAGLIGFVIVGFFVLAYKDAELRGRIFGGQAGMQFLTLFSLVIAIILFGITGILEGKELAALLGGLSGYILGRTTAPGDAVAPGRPA